MLEGNVNEYRQANQENKSVNPIAAAAGAACFILALPAAIIGLLELVDVLGYDIGMTLDSIIYTGTTLAILIGSGLSLTGVLNDTMKMGLGATLIAVSFLDLIRRISSINEELGWYGGTWLEAIQWGWVHEQMELSFLGMLIGIFIMTR
ncbi:MAG: hypothetical protein DBX06_06045 [Candidatus Poseidoniales archaeon]|nr:MAG: hypothetical protein DBX06_06045 [Candidatus Poseidoniales archaeon]